MSEPIPQGATDVYPYNGLASVTNSSDTKMQQGIAIRWRYLKDSIMQRTNLNRVDEEEKSEETQTMKSSKIEDGANLSPLHVAAIMGNKSKMIQLLKEHKEDIDKGDKIGRTPLIYSILGDRCDCAEALIKSGADVSKADVDERTALHWAAYQGNQKFVKLLLDKGAKQGLQDKEGRTPLHLSLSHDNIKVMARLLKDADIDCQDGNGMTPLHFSVAYERVEHTKMLLHAKASPDCLDNSKMTVLHWAKTNKETTIVSKLLDYERVMLILNSKDSEGRTALHLYVAVDNKALVRYLASREDCLLSEQDHMQRTPLHLAAILGHTEIAEVLLSHGCEALIPDNNGVRPLHYAAQNNFAKTLEAMLQHENVNDEPDNDGRTALMWAAAKGAYDALNVFISQKPDVLACDCFGATALHMASEGGHIQCVSLLLQHQAGVNALDEQQYTPLFCACQMGHREVVETLLLHGAVVDLEDKEGRTPLHWAAVGGRTEICAMLISHGSDVSKRDKLGRPALHYAAYGGFFSCMSLLLEYGSDVDVRDNTGVTALHWACASGSLDAVKLLFTYNAFPNFVETEGDKLTPLDYAIVREHQDVAQFMIEHGAFTIAGIQDEAATVIQATWRGYSWRKSFEERKQFLILHEKRRRETKKKSNTGENELPRLTYEGSQFESDAGLSKSFPKDTFGAPELNEKFNGSAYLEKESDIRKPYIQNDEFEHMDAYDNYLVHNPSGVSYDELVKNELSQDHYQRQSDVRFLDKDIDENEKGGSARMVSSEKCDNSLGKSLESDEGFLLENKFQSKIGLNDSRSYQNDVEQERGMQIGLRNEKQSLSSLPEINYTQKKLPNQKREEIHKVKNVSERLILDDEMKKPGPGDQLSNRVEKEYETKVLDRQISLDVGDQSVIQRTARLYKALPTPSTSSSTYSFSSNGNLKPWQIYKRERHRKLLIRRKIESAVVIQRAFRTHISKQRSSDGGRTSTAVKEIEARDRRIMEDIAALVIQLHWRKYMKRKLMKEKQEEKREALDARLLSARDRKQKFTLRPRSSENNETPRRRITSSKTRPKNTDNSTPRAPNQREEFPSIKNTNTKVDEVQVGIRDHTSQLKSRPKTDGNDSRRGSRTGQKISLAPAKQSRFHGKLLYAFYY
eukprot:gene13394-4257_t